MGRRVGRFYIDQDVVLKNPEFVQKVMSKVIVVRCESIWHINSFEYIAISNRFEEIDEAVIPPFYEVALKNGFVSFKNIGYEF